MKTHIERMIRAMTWADEQILAAVRDCPASQAEAVPLLAHLLAAEETWLARIEQRPATVEIWPQFSVQDCAGLVPRNIVRYSALLRRLSDEDLATPIRYQNTKGVEFTTPIVEILTHVVIHGAYHRGQIAKIVGRSGGRAPNTDFITFVREVEPD
jgi:uncharacterized damage-inducible protein DinB